LGLKTEQLSCGTRIINSIFRILRGHEQRVSSLAWNNNILSSGGLDGCIINHDTRKGHGVVSQFNENITKEVCGLKWSFDGNQLASGSNDNTL
jgi:cell division cycle protein 20 (cofactor of APC complex)